MIPQSRPKPKSSSQIPLISNTHIRWSPRCLSNPPMVGNGDHPTEICIEFSTLVSNFIGWIGKSAMIHQHPRSIGSSRIRMNFLEETEPYAGLSQGDTTKSATKSAIHPALMLGFSHGNIARNRPSSGLAGNRHDYGNPPYGPPAITEFWLVHDDDKPHNATKCQQKAWFSCPENGQDVTKLGIKKRNCGTSDWTICSSTPG